MGNIRQIKEQLVEYMDRCLKANGPERMDVDEMSSHADMVKDLSEAEYYCSVTEAMESYGYWDGQMPMGGYGYQEPMGYGGQGNQSGRSGYRDSRGRYASRPRPAYGQARYGYDAQAFHEMMETATPEERAEMKRALGM